MASGTSRDSTRAGCWSPTAATWSSTPKNAKTGAATPCSAASLSRLSGMTLLLLTHPRSVTSTQRSPPPAVCGRAGGWLMAVLRPWEDVVYFCQSWQLSSISERKKHVAARLLCPDPVRHMSVISRLAERATVNCDGFHRRLERVVDAGLVESPRRSAQYKRTQDRSVRMGAAGGKSGAAAARSRSYSRCAVRCRAWENRCAVPWLACKQRPPSHRGATPLYSGVHGAAGSSPCQADRISRPRLWHTCW